MVETSSTCLWKRTNYGCAKMKDIKPGTEWWAGDRKKFVVLHVIEQDGHTWVHYRENQKGSNQEYSCYAESFLSRFTPLPE